MVDILEEALNEAKAERRIILFRKIFPAILAVAVLIAAVMGAMEFYNYKKDLKNRAVGDLLLEAYLPSPAKSPVDNIILLEKALREAEGRDSEGMLQIALIGEGRGGKEAGSVESFAKKKQAMNKAAEIAESKKYDKLTSAYARILWLNLLLDESDITPELRDQALKYFAYFDADKNREFYSMSLLLKSLFYKKIDDREAAIASAREVLNLPGISEVKAEQARGILSTYQGDK